MKQFSQLYLLTILLSLFPSAFSRTEVLKISTGEFPPYVSQKLKELGPHAQAIHKVFAKSKYQVSIEVLPWNRAYDEVKKGNHQASFPWLKTESREKDLYYPQIPIESIVDVAVYTKSRFPKGLQIKSLEEIVEKKLRVVAIESYWYVAKLRELGAQITIAPSPQSAYAMLSKDRADLHINTDKVIDMELVEFYPDQQERKNFEKSKTALQSAPAYLAFSKKDPKHRELAEYWDRNAPAVLKSMGFR